MIKEKLIKMGISEEIALKCEEVCLEEIEKHKADGKGGEKESAEIESLREKVKDFELIGKQNEELLAELEKRKANFKEKIEALKTDNAISNEIKDFGGKNQKAIKALLELSNIRVEGEEVIGIREQLEKLINDEETKFLFEDTFKRKFRGVTPDFDDSEEEGLSKEEFGKMSYEEKNELFRKNKRLYNALRA